jgi:hypothetical protein
VDLCPPAGRSWEPAELVASPPTRRASGSVLDLPRLVAEERRRIAEENRRAAEKKDGPSKEKTGEAKTDPGLGPAGVGPHQSNTERAQDSAKPQKRRIERPAKGRPGARRARDG